MARRPAPPGSERAFVTALARGLDVLRCFKPDEPFLGNHDIAARVGLPRSTVSRLTGTLTELGYLRYVESRAKYELGPAMLAFSVPQVASAALRRRARPLMQTLADAVRASVSMGVQDGTSMVYVENCRSLAAITLSAEVGGRLPMAATAMGRAFLAAASDAERDYLMQRLQLEHSANWEQLRAGIERERLAYERHGYCVSLGEWYEDVHAVAVPLLPADGSPTVVLSVGGAAYQLSASMIHEDIGPRLVQAVRALSAPA